jgi:predicted dehydrogenase
MINIGILGAGFMGTTHAKAIAQLPNAKVAGVVSRRRERAEALANEVGATVYDSPEALIESTEVDVVDNTYPTFLHASYCIAALEQGKHVICEKPIAPTLADADAMIAASTKSGRHLMIAHVLRFWPEYVALREAVTGGELGQPLVAYAARLSFLPDWAEWIVKADLSGGPVVDLMIHDFDTLNWLLGRPKQVAAYGRPGKTGSWDHIFATLAYDEVEALAEGSLMMPTSFPFTSTLRVQGEKGCAEYIFRAGGPSVEMGTAQNALIIYPAEGEARQVTVEAKDPYLAQMEYFVDCLDAGRPPTRVSPEEARQALEVSLAARQSLESGQPVRL